MKPALIIFVRAPELGKVKTRLAASLGKKAALLIYQKLLQHTRDITDAVSADKFIFYADEIASNDIWQRPGYFKMKQVNGDLGQRMFNAFKYLFAKQYDKVCIIGSDCYELSSAIVEHAFQSLNKNDIVIGPATDGGYYLLGMNQLHSVLFADKTWSTDSVLSDTLEDLQRLKLTFAQLPELTDVDEAVDVPKEWLNDLSK